MGKGRNTENFVYNVLFVFIYKRSNGAKFFFFNLNFVF